ncbi:MAG: tyrosine-type recombinase/integrase, partial [Burkholderiales bacterium]|nr:tyrosine-type recombinase/integrase [Burkholderiales bacterium]
ASLGKYPEVSLAEAREKRDQMRKLVANGIDPVQSQKADKEAKKLAQTNSFEAVARIWFEGWKAARSPRHAEYVIRRLEADVFPVVGSRAVSEIQAPELVKMMKAIQRRGALDIAKRCYQMTGQVFRYAIAHGIAERNPAGDIKPSDILPSRLKTNYARVDTKELPALLRAIEAYRGTPVTRLAIKLLSLTFVRTSELIGARWDEFDLQAGQWRIPAERMKMRTEHIVPLSLQAMQILQILHGVTGHSKLLFPGERIHNKPMSNNTILKALERMGYKGRMTGHGFRGLASTILHEQGFDHAHIELQLAHQERNAVSAAYNHATYLKQRAKMMQWWGDYLDHLLRGNTMKIRKSVAY